MGALRITLLGKFEVQQQGQPVTGLEATKTQELLAYLLLYRQRSHYREKLATLLWEHSSPSHSKGYLRQTLWQLQSALGERTPLLLIESDWIQIDGTVDASLDVARFEQAYAEAKDIQGKFLTEAQAELLRDAVALYHGDLLENWYQDWCLFERERLQNMHLTMLEKLVGYCEAHQCYDAGIAYATQILRRDRAHERTYRRLMRLHYLVGDRTGALRTYDRCAAALEKELGVAPGQQTIILHKQIQADHFPQASHPPAADTTALSSILYRLLFLQRTLMEAEQQVAQEIETVRKAISRR